MRLVIPLANLSTAACSVELEEALLTVRKWPLPRDLGHAGKAPAAVKPPTEEGAPPEAAPWLDEGMLGAAAITDGVANIAGGIENILQRLRLHVSRTLTCPLLDHCHRMLVSCTLIRQNT